VFTIGLQLGPGFFAALRRQGARLNALAASVVVLGAAAAPLIGWLAGFDPAAVLGIFSGASTNTPSLGAATQTLDTLPAIAPDRLALPALAYAVTYPTAIAGIIGTLLLLKTIFRIDPAREAAEFEARSRRPVEALERRTLVVKNPNLDGVRLEAVPGRTESGVTISRVRHGEETLPAIDATVIHREDRLAVVGTPSGLDAFQRVVGQPSDEDLLLAESNLSSRRVVVTDRAALGKTVGELDLDDRFGVAVTRVSRADIEMSAVPGLRLSTATCCRSSAALPISMQPRRLSATRSRSSTRRTSSRSSSASRSGSRSARCPSPSPACLSRSGSGSPAAR
jgi:putative transport protein